MKSIKQSLRALPATARKGEKGFTLMEVLVTLAILAVLIGLVAAALGGRVTDTRFEAVASQAGQVLGTQRQLFTNELREGATNATTANNSLTMEELAGRLGTVLTQIDGITAVGDDTGATVCDGGTATDAGIFLTVDANLVADANEAAAVQSLLLNQARAAFDGGIGTAANFNDGNYGNVFGTADDDFQDALAATNTRINLCIGD